MACLCRRRAGLALAALSVLFLAVPRLAAAVQPARGAEHINLHRWTTRQDFAAGQSKGIAPADGGRSITIAHPVGQREYADPYGDSDRTWVYAQWTSPWHRLDFGARQLVASWTAYAPPGTWLQVDMRGITSDGEHTGWYVMGRWAARDTDIHRTSVPDQHDRFGRIAIDTFKAADGVTLHSYQLRTTLYQRPGGSAAPVLRSLSAMASFLPKRAHVAASSLGGAEGIVLDVPEFSQDIHKGEYPKWDGGGEAWCSPTSTSMVIAYWGRGPSQAQMRWVNPKYKDPQVDFAARGTYDYNYDGAGNWPFNIAYAGRFGLDGFVTRLPSLTAMEQFIKAGIPVITSVSFDADELPGAGYSTNGHLMVVVGFTKDGDVIANDPVAPSDSDVQLVYPRAAFENIWRRSTSSGGIVYIIYPPGHELPDLPSLDQG